MPCSPPFRIASGLSRLILALVAVAVLAAAILSRPARPLSDFDQLFYVTIAYDLDRYGVFSNSIFDNVDSTVQAPPAGMFFGPVYPALVLAAMKIDHRFADAARCSVEAINEHRDETTCEPYATPMRIIHALLLALGVLAIAIAGELMFRSRTIFWLAGALATIGLAAEADIFAFIMTEAVTFAIYSLCLLGIVLAWTTGRLRHFVLAGGLIGLLCLTRPSFLVLMPLVAGLSLLHGYRLCDPPRPFTGRRVLGLVLAFAAVLGAWGARNAISVGKFGLTEEYGSAVLIERFAYNDMTAHEFLLAFPYCVPGLGDLAFDKIYGTDSMHRFVFHTRDSFFHVGRDRRDALVAEHGRLDPLIGGIFREEMRANWWRHLLVAIPLAWCGIWAGGVVSLVLLPLFGWACLRAWRQSQPLLLLYAAPAITMLGLHAAVANHYTRYNLILIGPFALGTAWIISAWLPNVRRPPIRILREASE
jgi:4-amino-4-deoxy-L-arabinose transferase-like glycosyltransferase